MKSLPIFSSKNIIICFHKVNSLEWFRRTLRTIGRMYKYVSIEEIESHILGEKALLNSCHITFDDGDKTFVNNAYPVLRDMGIPATLFVSPDIIRNRRNYWFQEMEIIKGIIGEKGIKEEISESLGCDLKTINKFSVKSLIKSLRNKDIQILISNIKEKNNIKITKQNNINLEQLSDLINLGFIKIGAHTINHPILFNETDDTVNEEIRDSIKDLSRMCGYNIKYFAYPNGIPGLDFGQREKRILSNNGIKLAFATNSGFLSKNTDPLAIPRVGFKGSYTENRLWIVGKLLMIPFWDPIKNKFENEKAQRKDIAYKKIFAHKYF